jgi:glycosyltransferase involved in cell wall biosynthesis
MELVANPMVSVKVLAYNHGKFIRQCLDGILMQKTDFPFEVIIGEDCSPDNTRAICEEYKAKYPEKINLITSENNVGPRKNGIRVRAACRGKYQATCEGDDYWTDPFKLQKQVDFLEAHPEFIMCFHDCKIINEDGNIVSESKLGTKMQKDRSREDLVRGDLVPTLSVMFRSGLINEYPKEFYEVKNGDTFLFALLGQFGPAKYQGEIEPAVYRKHGGGVWSTLKEETRLINGIQTRLKLIYVIKGDLKRTAEVRFIERLSHLTDFYRKNNIKNKFWKSNRELFGKCIKYLYFKPWFKINLKFFLKGMK